MSQYVDSNTRTFTAGGTIAQYARVVLGSGGTVTAAGAVPGHGTACVDAVNTDVIAVRLTTAAGTHKMIASEAISVGSPVYAATSGKVSADGAFREGIALEAAGADGDVIEVMVVAGASSGGYLAVAQQTLAAGGGAVTVTEYYTAGASDAGGDAWTMADGTFAGQLKKVQLITDGGGDAILTPTTLTGGTTITFADAGDYALLLWDGDSWVAVELGNDADGATKPVLA